MFLQVLDNTFKKHRVKWQLSFVFWAEIQTHGHSLMNHHRHSCLTHSFNTNPVFSPSQMSHPDRLISLFSLSLKSYALFVRSAILSETEPFLQQLETRNTYNRNIICSVAFSLQRNEGSRLFPAMQHMASVKCWHCLTAFTQSINHTPQSLISTVIALRYDILSHCQSDGQRHCGQHRDRCHLFLVCRGDLTGHVGEIKWVALSAPATLRDSIEGPDVYLLILTWLSYQMKVLHNLLLGRHGHRNSASLHHNLAFAISL